MPLCLTAKRVLDADLKNIDLKLEKFIRSIDVEYEGCYIEVGSKISEHV